MNNPTPQNSDQQMRTLMGILGYIIPILFFLPLVIDGLKNDKAARFHANQQLNLLLFWIIGHVAGVMLSVVLIGLLLIPLVMLGGLVFMILGIINVAQGKMKPLPLIGGFTLLH